MKLFIGSMIVCVTLLSNTASSSDMIELCKVHKKLAELVMLTRQKGKTIEEAIEMRNNFNNPLGRKIIGSMIVPAYHVRIKPTEIEQMLEAVSFGDDQYKECLNEMMNN